MKHFNLEEYLKNPSRKVVTRDGRLIKFHCTNFRGNQPIVAQIEGDDHSVSFSENGRYYNDNYDSRNDLFFATEKHGGWVNVYRSGGLGCRCIFDSEEEARQNADEGAIATVKIEWEE